MLTRDKVLPVGSVVVLRREPDYKFLITGFYSIEENVLFDYNAVPYPLGSNRADRVALFGADQVETVLHEGYRGLGFELMLNSLDAVSERLKEQLDAGSLRVPE